MEYKIKNVHLEAESVDAIPSFPDIKDRIIEKRGAVQEFTMNDIEYNMKNLLNTKRELEAKREYENARAENIEHHHPFVKNLTDEEIVTVWMYKEATGLRKMCDDKLKLINEQLEKDLEEIEEIKNQIPELKESPVVEEALKIMKEEE